MSDLWIRRTFKSVSPDDTRGIYRKLKKTKGRGALIGGSPISGVSDCTMRVLGKILLSLSVLLWLFVALGFLFESSLAGCAAFLCFFGAHGLLTFGEMVTHRELPCRLLAMKVVWFPILVFLAFSFLQSVIQ